MGFPGTKTDLPTTVKMERLEKPVIEVIFSRKKDGELLEHKGKK
jgi:hypothetical protein